MHKKNFLNSFRIHFYSNVLLKQEYFLKMLYFVEVENGKINFYASVISVHAVQSVYIFANRY